MARNRLLDDYLNWTETALTNAHLPEAQAVLPPKYRPDKLAAGQALLEAARKEYDDQQTGIGGARASTVNKRAARAAADEVYERQLEAARIAFADDDARQEALGLRGRVPRAFGPWRERARQFYTALAADPDAVAALAELDETEATIEKGRTLVERAALAHAGRTSGAAGAQQETVQRDTAMTALKRWRVPFRRTILLKTRGNPQLRELFGITEPS